MTRLGLQPDRIDLIRARLLAAKEGYAVHVGCNSEVVADGPEGSRNFARYFCNGCHQSLSVEQVATLDDAPETYREDVAFLLDAVETMGRHEYVNGEQRGHYEEQHRIVRWLREDPCSGPAWKSIADQIEKGEHWKPIGKKPW